jgi:hypothetical protein
MALCTHSTECGPLGEVELTISYKYRPARPGRGSEQDEPESACIYWIKIGGVDGTEVPVAGDYIADEIIPTCVEDWTASSTSAAQQYNDAVRIERMEREAVERRAA